MAEGTTVLVTGLKELMTACDLSSKEMKKQVRAEMRGVGDIVRHDAVRRLSPYSVRSAFGYRTRVYRHSVVVAQSLKKSVILGRRRRNWGKFQMTRVLRPALAANTQRVETAFLQAVDRVCNQFGSKP